MKMKLLILSIHMVMMTGLMFTSSSTKYHTTLKLQFPTQSSRVRARPLLSMEFDWKSTKKGAEDKMAKSLESMQSQFNTLRAGGANPALLDRVVVDYFGSITPLNQVARVAASGSQQLIVEPFDKSSTKDVEVYVRCTAYFSLISSID